MNKPKTQPVRWLHQVEACKATVAGFKISDRGQVIMACGSGKSRTALWIAQDLKASRILVMVPSISLVAQTVRVWLDHGFIAAERILAICSDTGVAKGDMTEAELRADTGVVVTTDPVIARAHTRADRILVVCTYASGRVLEAMFTRACPSFDLAIADEAHRTVGETMRDSAIIVGSSIKATKRLFMTATTKALRQGDREDPTYVHRTSMDDASQYGPVFYTLTFQQAQDRKILVPLKLVLALVSDHDVAKVIATKTIVFDDGSKLDARTVAAHLALDREINERGLRKVLTYHNSIAGARHFAESHHKVIKALYGEHHRHRKVWINSVSADTPMAARQTLFDSFLAVPASETAVMANCRILAEGVDFPNVDAIMFVDPKESPIMIAQAMGRPMRTSPGKTEAVVLLPLLIQQDKIAARDGVLSSDVLHGTSYQAVRLVTLAMSTVDEDGFEQLRHDLARAGAADTEAYVTTTKGLDVSVTAPLRLSATVAAALVKSLHSAVLRMGGQSSVYEALALREAYIRKHGRLPTGADKSPEARKLRSLDSLFHRIRNKGRRRGFTDATH